MNDALREALAELVRAKDAISAYLLGGGWTKEMDATLNKEYADAWAKARAILAATPSAETPREPTQLMITAGVNFLAGPKWTGSRLYEAAREMWRAMYAAHPSAEPLAAPERPPLPPADAMSDETVGEWERRTGRNIMTAAPAPAADVDVQASVELAKRALADDELPFDSDDMTRALNALLAEHARADALREELEEAKSEVAYVYGREATIGREAKDRAEALHGALRRHAITYSDFLGFLCMVCKEKWGTQGREHHAPNCLAAPTPTEGAEP